MLPGSAGGLISLDTLSALTNPANNPLYDANGKLLSFQNLMTEVGVWKDIVVMFEVLEKYPPLLDANGKPVMVNGQPATVESLVVSQIMGNYTAPGPNGTTLTAQMPTVGGPIGLSTIAALTYSNSQAKQYGPLFGSNGVLEKAKDVVGQVKAWGDAVVIMQALSSLPTSVTVNGQAIVDSQGNALNPQQLVLKRVVQPNYKAPNGNLIMLPGSAGGLIRRAAPARRAHKLPRCRRPRCAPIR